MNVTHKQMEAEWDKYGPDEILSHEYGFTEVPRHWMVCDISFWYSNIIWDGLYFKYSIQINGKSKN